VCVCLWSGGKRGYIYTRPHADAYLGGCLEMCVCVSGCRRLGVCKRNDHKGEARLLLRMISYDVVGVPVCVCVCVLMKMMMMTTKAGINTDTGTQ
jgi:hypothetical protein